MPRSTFCANGRRLRFGVGRRAREPLVDLGQHALQRRQRAASGFGAGREALVDPRTRLIDQAGGLLDHLAGFGQPGLERRLGAFLRFRRGRGHQAARGARLGLERFPLAGGDLGDGPQRLRRLRRDLVALLAGRGRERAQLFGGRLDHLPQHLGALGGGLAELGGAFAGLARDRDQLRALRLRFGGIGLVVGAHAVRGGDQGRALLAHALLDRTGLRAGAGVDRLQSLELARRGCRRPAGRHRRPRRRPPPDRRRGRRARPPPLESGSRRDPRLRRPCAPGPRSPRRPPWRAPRGEAASVLQPSGLRRQALGQGAGGAAGVGGGGGEARAVPRQRLSERRQAGLGVGGRGAGLLDLGPYGGDRRAGLPRGQGGGGEQALRQEARLTRVGGEPTALLGEKRGHPDEDDRGCREQGKLDQNAG